MPYDPIRALEQALADLRLIDACPWYCDSGDCGARLQGAITLLEDAIAELKEEKHGP